MSLMAAAGEITPMPKAAIFADTQDEPQSVYDWLNWLEKQLPFPVHRATTGQLSAFALKEKKNQKTGVPYYSNTIPVFTKGVGVNEGRVGRYCTRDFKIIPIIRTVKKIASGALRQWRQERNENKRISKIISGAFSAAGTPRLPSPVVIQWIGISSDEIYRMKPSRDPWCEHRWPLVEARKNRNDCLQWMKAKGFPEPPRSACRYCPFKSDFEWRQLRRKEPSEFDRAVVFERELQKLHASITSNGKIKGVPFLHRSLKPLDQVDFSTEEERGQLNMFNNECEGMCGV